MIISWWDYIILYIIYIIYKYVFYQSSFIIGQSYFLFFLLFFTKLLFKGLAQIKAANLSITWYNL